jgi:hypothetical protein
VWFFGDRERLEDPRTACAELAARLVDAAGRPPGPERHAALCGALVRGGELAQGIADAEAAVPGSDVDGPGGRAAHVVLATLGRALLRSFEAGGCAPAPPRAALAPLRSAPLPEAVRTRRAEGFAVYGVYPETYAIAGRALRGADPTVLGIRSIGCALAAMVAAGAAVRRAPLSVRPRGDPFRREVGVGPDLAAAIARGAGRPYAVVDEGPGLSGSSFAAAAAALRALRVPQEAIHLFPSHPGVPGPEADPAARALFAAARRHHVAFEDLFLAGGPLALGRLAADAVGRAEAPPEDLAAGRWRGHLPLPRGAWPPSQGWRERRKYLLRAGGRRWLARFAGLGDGGERALARARTLAAAGLAPTPVALRHGFLLERWEEGAVPLHASQVPRARALEAVRRLVLFVAELPAGEGEGASPRALLEMARANAREALGAASAAGMAAVADLLGEVERTARPVAVDGKLQRWEWLVRPDGAILKADALDHHADHALVGCQDALWDVAGAALEHDLDPGDARALAEAVRARTRGAPPRCLTFFRVAYAAFEAGRWALAAGDAGVEAEEALRRRREAARYRDALRQSLAAADGAAAAAPV